MHEPGSRIARILLKKTTKKLYIARNRGISIDKSSSSYLYPHVILPFSASIEIEFKSHEPYTLNTNERNVIQ